MRISDWSSDVCSSDLLAGARFPAAPARRRRAGEAQRCKQLLQPQQPGCRDGAGPVQPAVAGDAPVRRIADPAMERTGTGADDRGALPRLEPQRHAPSAPEGGGQYLTAGTRTDTGE